ncbi:MAG: 4-(cytidine 5'-diphospho)-2-C-methyl-D-erythritol kinase [Armatimonadota bacterium]|nr:4-(cytidine 5'-diphospho)-2-C-methyl-D-erythritol kinase [Armatimonadota bacterium]MCX7777090.1 4-(cytidine 5'-diphospho)-2-C-methyl-D-erythritol kinase [Armatimonadota bacterium]MDW8025137.1 4-(cytidine 5'-diphospho)-2-C-methyl-D-erythritol kinase [Armatimonadota bacterium]
MVTVKRVVNVTVRCAAKVNLFLDIRGKRPDGYHEIVSVMCPIDLRDTLVATLLPPKEGFKLVVSNANIPNGNENTVWKAAEALARAANVPMCGLIRLYKQIPVAAGLGGGSSNAAAALVALNKLWNLGLKQPDLMEIAKSIGADVPFFIHGGWALVEGFGDVIVPLNIKAQLWMLLVKPPVEVPTAWAYKVWDLKGKPEGRDPAPLIEALQCGDLSAAGKHLYNAFEAVVSETHTEISYLKKLLLRTEPLGVVMSGSGPTIVGLFATRKEAEAAKQWLSEELRRCYEGSGLFPSSAEVSNSVWIAIASVTQRSMITRIT